MNWEAIGASGEVLGSVLVIATLVYLSIQIRQTNNTALYNAQKDLLAGFDEINKIIATDHSIRDVLLKKDKLSASEERQIYAFAAMYGAAWISAEQGLKHGQIWKETYLTVGSDVLIQLEQWPALRQPLNQWLDNYPNIENRFEIVQPIRASA